MAGAWRPKVQGTPAVGYALKPIAEAMAKVKEARGAGRELEIIRQRLDLLEQQLGGLDSEVHRLSEAQEFQAKLQAPPG